MPRPRAMPALLAGRRQRPTDLAPHLPTGPLGSPAPATPGLAAPQVAARRPALAATALPLRQAGPMARRPTGPPTHRGHCRGRWLRAGFAAQQPLPRPSPGLRLPGRCARRWPKLPLATCWAPRSRSWTLRPQVVGPRWPAPVPGRAARVRSPIPECQWPLESQRMPNLEMPGPTHAAGVARWSVWGLPAGKTRPLLSAAPRQCRSHQPQTQMPPSFCSPHRQPGGVRAPRPAATVRGCYGRPPQVPALGSQRHCPSVNLDHC
mmetsp:Transcript_30231/g.96557  ORF Transcript_30231/g.96557 Transcript_30231/m.96557 type:complete len:263 (-) Transcript_30231:2217-3005(-)